ncbi:MAG: rhodanese-like domain-containing protein [Legionellaceae bacterium]|nr:rhodanese-like domain-containing protein [Legionellaceae bacterium]
MAQLSEFVINHWQLWAALLAVLLLIVLNEHQAKKQQAAKVSPQSLVTLINHDKLAIYDIRPQESFREGHIVGAHRVNKDDFDKKPLCQSKDKAFVLVCDNGISSGSLAQNLKKSGFTQIMVLNGGMRAWQESDLPLIKGK